MSAEKKECVSCGNLCNESSVREEHKSDCALAAEMWRDRSPVDYRTLFLKYVDMLKVTLDGVPTFLRHDFDVTEGPKPDVAVSDAEWQALKDLGAVE